MAFRQLLHLVWKSLQRRCPWLAAGTGKISPGSGLGKPREEEGGCWGLYQHVPARSARPSWALGLSGPPWDEGGPRTCLAQQDGGLGPLVRAGFGRFLPEKGLSGALQTVPRAQRSLPRGIPLGEPVCAPHRGQREE